MFTKYDHLKAVAEYSDEGALYGAVVALHDMMPEWRRDRELASIMKHMGKRLEDRGWTVELGLKGRNSPFILTPPIDQRQAQASATSVHGINQTGSPYVSKPAH